MKLIISVLLISTVLFQGVHCIVDGDEADLVPTMVSVQYQGSHICSGIILSEDTILSSAEPLYNLKAEDIQVVAGIKSLDEKTASNTYKVSSIYLYDNYNIDVNENNTSILKLSKKINLEAGKTEAACLRMYDVDLEDLEADTFGWGSTQTHTTEIKGSIQPKPESSNELRTAKFTTIAGVSSKNLYYLQPSSGTQSTCIFDQGSVLVITEKNRSQVIGITDSPLMANDNSDVNSMTICPGRSAFIKPSSIESFIKRHATSKLCLIYKDN